MNKVAYQDLQDSSYVYDALLGYGMFAEKLPPCFSSDDLLAYSKSNTLPSKVENHSHVEYQATRNTNIPRQLAIPHPESYWRTCSCIKDHWQSINEHIGKPAIKFNYSHVRMIKGKHCIFEMNYEGVDKWQTEEMVLDYSLGCQYVVCADISTFFPSVYAHSIPWAIEGKEWAKKHQCTSNKKKKKGDICKTNDNQPCPHTLKDIWSNDLDYYIRSMKDGETNGLLIGPHTSNIISEIILTQVDHALQSSGYKKVIRHIDDYTYYAENEQDARNFLINLMIELKKFELVLNAKKTKIIRYQDFSAMDWISQLNQFSFPSHDSLGFTSVNSYIDFAISLGKKNNDYAVLKYAIKVISSKKLTNRAKRLYIKKILQIALDFAYLLPLLEDKVFLFANDNFDFMSEFTDMLVVRSLEKGETDALAYAFYFAIKYDIDIQLDSCERVIELNDCISLLLAYKYCEKTNRSLAEFDNKAAKIMSLSEREKDKFWLFIYEVIDTRKLPNFLKKLKTANCRFLNF